MKLTKGVKRDLTIRTKENSSSACNYPHILEYSFVLAMEFYDAPCINKQNRVRKSLRICEKSEGPDQTALGRFSLAEFAKDSLPLGLP